MEIFNFYRKFESNLLNELSGKTVNKLKFHRSSFTPPACRRRSVLAAFPRAGTSPSPWRLRRALSQPGELIPAINSLIATVVPPISPSALLRRQLAPPLAVASVDQHPSCPATPTRSPQPCASLRLTYATWVGQSRPAQRFLPRDRPELRPHLLDVARPFQTVSGFTERTGVTMVSY